MGTADFLFGFKGRLGRAPYWLYCLFSVPAAGGLVYAVYALVQPAPGKTVVLAAFLAIILGGVLAYSTFAVNVRRLHDRDKSAWWLLTFWLAPALLSGTGQAAGKASAAWGSIALLNVIGSALSLWGVIELGCRRGTQGPNQYGPDPRESAAAVPTDANIDESYPALADFPQPSAAAPGAWLPRARPDRPRPRFGKRST